MLVLQFNSLNCYFHVKPVSQAREDYDDALSSGQQAFLLEESEQWLHPNCPLGYYVLLLRTTARSYFYILNTVAQFGHTR